MIFTKYAPKTPTQRVAKMREEAKRKGWKRREYYATDEEHQRLKFTLETMRQANEGKNQ